MKRLFGTLGFRGRVNETLTSMVAHDLGLAFANFVGTRKTIGVGWDTRISSEMLGLAVSAGLMRGGCNVHLLGLVPTPLLSHAIPQLKFDGGVMITASHNPPEYNGIKLWGSDGAAFTTDMELQVESFYYALEKPYVSWEKCGHLISFEDYRDSYIKRLLQQVDISQIINRKFAIVADCGGGAASRVVPRLFQAIGTEVECLYCEPDGLFQNRLPEPTENNLGHLIQRVRDNDVDMGMAWDGDADRLVLISHTGRYLMGDRTFALAAFHWLRTLKKKPKRIVTSVATSDVIRDVAKAVNAELSQTPVGESHIVKKMKEEKAQLGGSETGGVIFAQWSWTRDSFLTALIILDLMNNEKQSLEQLDQRFPSYFQVKERIPCQNELKAPLLAQVASLAPTHAEIETLDGIKLRYSDGWVLLRPSGTEPLFRVFAEAKTENRAKNLAEKGLHLVQDILEDINPPK